MALQETAQAGETERLYTADDLLRIDVEGKHYELIHGRLIEVTPTNQIHGEVEMEIARLIANHVRAGKLGRVYGAETGFRIVTADGRESTLGADAAFVAAARAGARSESYFEGAPDLAVEVYSPGNTRTEIQEKIALYFAGGARLVWVVYPRSRTVYVYTGETQVSILKAEDTLSGGEVLPGFSLKVGEIFQILDE